MKPTDFVSNVTGITSDELTTYDASYYVDSSGRDHVSSVYTITRLTISLIVILMVSTLVMKVGNPYAGHPTYFVTAHVKVVV